ncbi:MAG: hypothetical protein IJO70_12545 [Lachnospiraceae bacterium]|nr:hypothetical protein [Lachnospiraceae bacterium]
MNQIGTYVNIMKESLVRKKNYLQVILELTNKQGELAVASELDEEAFSSIVDRKDVLISNVNEIDKGFTAVYDRVRKEIIQDKDLYKEDLKAIQDSIRQCVDLGMAIESAELRNKSALETAFAKSFRGVKQLKQSKQVANKYYKSMSNGMVNDSILYDRKK